MSKDPKSRARLLLTLALTFLKIGAFTFGGGYAMIALLEREFVGRKQWIDKKEFLDMVAIAESTPGPIAVNSATYIGYRIAGVAGSLVSTLAVALPSFVIIYAISLFFDAFLSLTLVACAFRGIQVCVVWLILDAGLKMLKSLDGGAFPKTVLVCVIVLMTLFSLLAVDFSSVFFILIAGAVGLCLWGIRRLKRQGKGGTDE